MLDVKTRIVVSRAMPLPEQRAAFRHLLEELGQDMADQVRLNIVRFGKPGGDGGWPPVSGWKQSSLAASGRAARAHSAAAKRTTGEQRARHLAEAKAHRAAGAKNRELNKRIRASENAAKQHAAAGNAAEAARHREHAAGLKKQLMTMHSLYARRKELGQTPGHGKFHADELLRDTEALYASIDATIMERGNDATISLVATGNAPGRDISNQRLLEIHALGEGNMPKRDPTSDMTNYEQRVQRRLDLFWDRVFQGKGTGG